MTETQAIVQAAVSKKGTVQFSEPGVAPAAAVGANSNALARGGSMASMGASGVASQGAADHKERYSLASIQMDSMKKSRERPKDDIGDRHPLRRIAFIAGEEMVISPGRFSWFSSFVMSSCIVTGAASLVLMCLALRDTGVEMISIEVSYINARNPPQVIPPWGYVKQPNSAADRKIGQEFAYAMPQAVLFYSMFCASFGIFTVAYFCSEMLIQDQGVARVKQVGMLINKGVDVFLFRTVPIIMVVMCVVAVLVYFVAGFVFTVSTLVGASTCLLCSNLGVNMNFEGGTRVTHALNTELAGAFTMSIRTGAIGGLAAHSMAQVGVVLVWVVFKDAASLVGFGTGVSIVAFYTRIGGGIFAKGCDIGSDFVCEMMDMDFDDYNMEMLTEMRDEHGLDDKDGDGEIDADALDRKLARDPNAHMSEEDHGFITEEEAKIRAKVEAEMEKALQKRHPMDYVDMIGENIADVGGTSSDLFETMCITLATSVVLGSKAHDAPSFGTSLPFNVISTGTLMCSICSYYVWCHEKHSSTRIRMQLRLNLLFVIIMVQGMVVFVTYNAYRFEGLITERRMVNYNIIVFMGLISPEICATICEFFTGINYPPVSWLAKNADLGTIQIVLQGLGQGFVSAGVPSAVNIVVQIFSFQLEGFYGLVLLACASQACTGWQATLASYGAIANNASRLLHLTTVNEVAHHRANALAVVGTTTSHSGKCVGGQAAFFATTSLLGALLAEKYTKMGQDFQNTVGQQLSEWTRAGLLAGIVFTMLFLANTLTSCIAMAKRLVKFCKDNDEVLPRQDKTFPATHILPLKKLTAYAAIESFQLTFAPLLQSLGAPLVIGQLFGFKGLLMLVSGGNSVCFSLNMFLINAGQAWDAAHKYVIFGMLKDEHGDVVEYRGDLVEALNIGEQIGGPLEDLTGPALNNFIKFVAVVSFVTNDMYDETPEKSWPYGVLQFVINCISVSFFKFGLSITIKEAESFFRRRRERQEYEEGTQMLREIEHREREIEKKLRDQFGKDDLDMDLA